MSLLTSIVTLFQPFKPDSRDVIARFIRTNPQLQQQVEDAITFLGAGHLAIIANHLPRDQETRDLLTKHNLTFAALADTTDSASPRIQLLAFLRYFAPVDYQIPTEKGSLSVLLQKKYAAFKESVIRRVLALRNDPEAKTISKQLFQPIFAELDQGFYLISNLVTKIAELELLQQKQQQEH